MRRAKLALCALRWRDVDFDRGELTVRYAMERVKGEGMRIKQPKTVRSRRRLALSSPALAMLKAHRTQQIAQRGIRPDDSDWLFDGLKGPLAVESAWHAVKRVLLAANLGEHSLKALRSTHGTVMLTDTDASIDEVSRRLGHADSAITLRRYIGAVTGREKDLAEAFGDVVVGHEDPLQEKAVGRTDG